MTSPRLTGAVVALFLLAMSAAFLPCAQAYQAAEQNDSYEIRPPEFDNVGHDSYARLVGEQQAIESLGARFGGQWRVHEWNPWTGTPRWIYGDGPQLSAGVSSAAQVETLSRTLIAAHPAVFGAELSDLRLSATPRVPGKWAAHFQQTFKGLDVWDAKIRIVLSDTGRLVLAGSDFHSDIQLDPNPGLSAAQAVEIARAALPFDPATDSVEEAVDLLVLPVPRSVTDMDYRLVWRVRVHTESPLGIWVSHVDTHDGSIPWRYNDVHFAYSGDAESDIQPITYCNGVHTQPARYMDVNVDGLGTVATDADGNWSVAGSGGARPLTARFYGPYCNVYQVVGGSLGLYTGIVEDGVPHSISFTDFVARHDERDVFDGVNDLHHFFQLFAPEFNYMHNRMNARVNINDCCNAFWNGTINFFTECGGCANTGEIQDVVWHEHGHGIQAAILGWQGNQGLGEGNGDITGNIMSVDHCVGRGFNLNACGICLRDSHNSLVYPDNVIDAQIHDAGRVIAGFNWDAMAPMMAQYGELDGRLISAANWHYGRVLLHPTTQPAQVLATFTVDDDDGNLDNGTPNWHFYAAAAENHGFTPPEISEGLLFTHAPLGDTDDTASPYSLVIGANSTNAPIDDSSVKLVWRIDEGAWSEAAMTPVGFGDSYAGEIPAQQQGIIEYYFTADDTDGNSGSEPYGAPFGAYQFRVAWLVDAFEATDAQWTVGDSNDTATEGIWERVDPIGTIAQPEDDHTVAGTDCWITGQHTPGEADDFNDVDGGLTTLISPTYDVSGSSSVNVRFYKWYDNRNGSFPGVDPWRIWISNDGGDNWEISQLSARSTSGWDPVEFELTDYYPSPDLFRIKFSVQDLGGDTTVEGGVDDLVIMALTTTGIDEDFSVTVLPGLEQNVPNPFNPRTEIRFTLPTAQRAGLKVFGASGRLVKTLAEGVMEAGEHRRVWDGKDSNGRSVSTGVYFYRLETDEQVRSRRMVLIK